MPDLAERFWSKVDRRGPNDCWPWSARWTQGRGYGVIRDDQGNRIPASHAALILSGRPRPEGMEALHSCDNPPCCNERHLSWGTHADNGADMTARARQPRGEDRDEALLTEAAVLDVRLRYAEGMPQTALAQQYQVTRACISKVVTGKTWAHVGGPITVLPVGGRNRKKAPSGR